MNEIVFSVSTKLGSLFWWDFQAKGQALGNLLGCLEHLCLGLWMAVLKILHCQCAGISQVKIPREFYTSAVQDFLFLLSTKWNPPELELEAETKKIPLLITAEENSGV